MLFCYNHITLSLLFRYLTLLLLLFPARKSSRRRRQRLLQRQQPLHRPRSLRPGTASIRPLDRLQLIRHWSVYLQSIAVIRPGIA